jgi:hypothetical protein
MTHHPPHKLHLLDQALRQFGLWLDREALAALVERLTKEMGE